MPKLTRTGHELGSSESAPVVLMKTTYQTNQDVLIKKLSVERELP